ncbi:MAG: Lactate utilization protein [Gemmatimonadetes bacterium]|nr:Lactate utilization protein [Gemmatimonadota bacterium]
MSRTLTVLDSAPVDHAANAAAFNENEARVDWHNESLGLMRAKRDRAVEQVPEWEALRAVASSIKEHTLSHLDEYLTMFEAAAIANGAKVHWARDAEEHNRIVHHILVEGRVQYLVKSKSMLTEECHLNAYLEERGIDVVDTDLGERIVQLRKEPPSHIVMPASHLTKEEIGETFAEHLGTAVGLSDPTELTAAARIHLRERFLRAHAAMTGVNFAIAETGGVVVCTNEGNADLGMALAPIHIASMGIEKLVPGPAELAVFLRVLARSATGQRVTVYTSHVHRPEVGQALHIIIVDNGRTEQLGRPDFWRSLKCIRCGACMNTCPVYRRSGGYSYGATVPGPIGSILSPGIDLRKYAALPFASTLCGSCTAVCPVKIDLDAQLYRWRQIVVDAGLADGFKTVAANVGARVLSNRRWLHGGGAIIRIIMKLIPMNVMRRLSGSWGKTRDLPVPPGESFSSWYRANRPAKGPP